MSTAPEPETPSSASLSDGRKPIDEATGAKIASIPDSFVAEPAEAAFKPPVFEAGEVPSIEKLKDRLDEIKGLVETDRPGGTS
jgi:hypothetical protein